MSALILPLTKLSVSMEGTSVRLLASRGRRLRWWADVALEPHLLRGGFLTDTKAFSVAIGAAEKVHKLPRREVVAALPGFQSLSRIVRLPREARRNIGTIVDGEARRFMPDAGRAMQISWQALGQNGSADRDVFILGVPRQPLLTYIEALTAAGLPPKSVDLRPLALARAVNKKDAIVGNAESMAIDVVIVRNDVPVAMRSLYLGSDFQAIEDVNARLAEELVRTVTHFNSTSQDGPLPAETPIYLTGSGAANPSLATMIEELTQYPIAPLTPPFDCPADFPVAEFMVHLGLILK